MASVRLLSPDDPRDLADHLVEHLGATPVAAGHDADDVRGARPVDDATLVQLVVQLPARLGCVESELGRNYIVFSLVRFDSRRQKVRDDQSNSHLVVENYHQGRELRAVFGSI